MFKLAEAEHPHCREVDECDSQTGGCERNQVRKWENCAQRCRRYANEDGRYDSGEH